MWNIIDSILVLTFAFFGANGCDIGYPETGTLYIDNVESIGRESTVILTIGVFDSDTLEPSDTYCKTMDTDDGDVSIDSSNCSLYKHDTVDFMDADSDPTSTVITDITNNIGTVTITLTRNSQEIQIEDIPFNSTDVYWQNCS